MAEKSNTELGADWKLIGLNISLITSSVELFFTKLNEKPRIISITKEVKTFETQNDNNILEEAFDYSKINEFFETLKLASDLENLETLLKDKYLN